MAGTESTTGPVTDGFRLAFWVGVGLAALAFATASVVLKRGESLPEVARVESPRERADGAKIAA